LKVKRFFTIGNIIALLIITLIMACSFFPFLWMIISPFRTRQELFLNPLGIPKTFNFEVFSRAWTRANFGSAIRNSIITTVCAVAITVICSSLAAYPISRIKFKGRGFIYMFIVSGFIISGQITLIPLFVLFRDMHLLATLSSVILACGTSGIPFSTILFVNAFRDIPREIDDSTEMDGCSRIRYFIYILIPLTGPIFASVIIFQSMSVWNEYLLSLTFLTRPELRTIPLELKNFFFRFTADWQGLFAALSMMVVPILVLYVVLQKYFIKGLTSGAVKG
jgi:ABC-type glycerol-3-phosphate transport system permease component